MAFGIPRSQGGPLISYGSYLRIEPLLSLQNLRSEPAQHDELLFIIIHQVYELWFKQLLHELDAIVARLGEDQPLGAQRLLVRCIEIERVLIAQIKVLETMTPNDFLRFRDLLMPASGFQSFQFRCIEFVCGAKNARHVENYDAGSMERAELERRLLEPTVGECFYELLRRRGFDLPTGAGPDDAAAHEERIRELTRLYHDPDEHYDLYLLAETLVEFDEMFSLWRLHHIQMVERMIGSKPGTGGSEGVAYLRTTLDRKFFPELWELRSHLSARSQ